MRCPRCWNTDDKVIDSRTLANHTTVRRRRECLTCGYRFTSYERVEEKPLLVVKSSGRREPFRRDKLERGVHRALEKRPISRDRIENMLNDVEEQAELLGGSTHEVNAGDIGELVLRRLYRLDRVGYVRFASVYRRFESVGEFVSEIERLTEEESHVEEGQLTFPDEREEPGEWTESVQAEGTDGKTE